MFTHASVCVYLKQTDQEPTLTNLHVTTVDKEKKNTEVFFSCTTVAQHYLVLYVFQVRYA